MTRIFIILILLPIIAFAGFEVLVYAVNNTVMTKNGKTYTFYLADPANPN